MNHKDPGCPTISIVIRDQLIHGALLKLGASANLMPFTMYKRLGLGDLKPTKMVINLADRWTHLPRAIVEDMLIRVGEFIYNVYYVVIETKKAPNVTSQIPMILGFLSWLLPMSLLIVGMA